MSFPAATLKNLFKKVIETEEEKSARIARESERIREDGIAARQARKRRAEAENQHLVEATRQHARDNFDNDDSDADDDGNEVAIAEGQQQSKWRAKRGRYAKKVALT
jgi:signal transduction histidine kinase